MKAMTGKEALENYKDIITENKKLKETIKVLTCTNDSAIIQNLKAENQELKEKADKYDSAQRIVLSTKGIDVIMKLQAENEKLKKFIEILEEKTELRIVVVQGQYLIQQGAGNFKGIYVSKEKGELLKEVLGE